MGSVCESESIPKFILTPGLNLFSYFYNVNKSDMTCPIDSFGSFQKFFTRSVKPREITRDDNAMLVPADSELISLSKVNENDALMVKDLSYSVSELVYGDSKALLSKSQMGDSNFYSSIFYLRPGDYHRCHSPADFEISQIRHITGDLKTVEKGFVFKKPVN